jgi:hypothetical protein
MKLGADRKRVIILGVLLAVAAYIIYSNMTSSDVPPQTPRPARMQPAAVGVPAPVRAPETRAAAPTRSARGGSQEFRPSLKPRRPEDRLDPSTVDPTLRLDLLAKLQTVPVAGGMRSLFEFSTAPPPPPRTPDPKIIPKRARFMGPLPVLPPGAAPAVPRTPPPPINLRFYGYVSSPRPSAKRAFFLDGENIFVASEGEIIQHRYKIVRIGINSVVVEDTEYQNQQTLPLVKEQGS